MYSTLIPFVFTVPAGAKDYSNTFSIATNANFALYPQNKNLLTKSINFYLTTNIAADVIKFYDIRFLGTNADISLITQNAGIIQNPVSGDWGNTFVKDSILDFNLTSKKNTIYFKDGILLGGVRPVSLSVQFTAVLPNPRNIFGHLIVQYDE